MVIEYNGNSILVKLGLSGIMLLGENLKINEKDLGFYLYCCLFSFGYSRDECNNIINSLSDQQKDMFLRYIGEKYNSLSEDQYLELYSQCVGQMGIQPSEFYKMSIDEIDSAYEGYLTNKEIEANLILNALIYNKKNINKYISLRSDEIQKGSKEEREKTFQYFGMEGIQK